MYRDAHVWCFLPPMYGKSLWKLISILEIRFPFLIQVQILISTSTPLDASCLRGWVRVHLPLSTSQSDVDESAGILYSLLGTTLGGLLLLLWLNLWCLRLDLSGTSEGSVNLSHDCGLSVCS